MSDSRMTDQQLARGLVIANLLTPQQVQMAAQKRTAGVGFAQILVELGWVSTMDILNVDPHAFEAPPSTAGQGRGVPEILPSEIPTAPQSEIEIGLGINESEGTGDDDIQIAGESRQADDPEMGVIVRYCNELLKIAISLGASDMHLEPHEDGLLPRYRVDGQLRPGGLIPTELQAPIISRLKVLSDIDITENRLPQDGRFRATIGPRVFDFRVSTLPSLHGEKVVLRLLDRTSLVTDLVKLGFSGDSRALFEEMLRRSYGLILVTGPTGSGKTTTLYAALSTTRDETKNVITVEDPVEYELAGVTQTNVQPDIELTFATQLRAILRQDPDVILVGEIRDNETADIAVRAALTGHLVLSTLHTNSAVAAVARLQDMDVPNFLLASSLSGVLAQRLVRMICRNCRTQVPQESPQYDIDITRLRLTPGTPLYHGVGCDRCKGTGMRGRMALIELLNVDGEIRQSIMENADADSLRRIAIRNGMRTLWQDALDKVQQGLTTGEEVARALLGAEDAGASAVEDLSAEA